VFFIIAIVAFTAATGTTPRATSKKGEDDLAAALRELAEETGIRRVHVILGFKHSIVCFFRRSKHKTVTKTVIFFLASTHDKNVRVRDEHVGYAWLPEQAAAKRLTCPTARQVFAKAVAFLRCMRPAPQPT